MGDDELITPLQAKRLVERGAQVFIINVTEDPLATSDIRDGYALAHGDEEADVPVSGPLTAEQIDVLGSIRPEITELLLKHAGVFATPHGLLPDRGIDHVIREYPGSKPVYRPPRRVCPSEAREVQARVRYACASTRAPSTHKPSRSVRLFRARICCSTVFKELSTLAPLICAAGTTRSVSTKRTRKSGFCHPLWPVSVQGT
eukprot:112014-Chlamydomonas_euryale.AAC.1